MLNVYPLCGTTQAVGWQGAMTRSSAKVLADICSQYNAGPTLEDQPTNAALALS